MPSDISYSLGHGLLPFLKQTRQHLPLPTAAAPRPAPSASLPIPINSSARAPSPIYVFGNQSADLDSIISAILYSYFFSRATKRLHVPLVNLPDVPSGTELRRLRPEFACAFGLATTSSSSSRNQADSARKNDDDDGIVQLLKDHIITVADLRERLLSSSFGQVERGNQKLELEAVLVDWNKLPLSTPTEEKEKEGKEGKIVGRGTIAGLSDLASFSVIGCIDHHADEGFISPRENLSDDNPRVIELGPGSCTSLIIREVQRRGLWPTSSSSSTTDDQPSTNDANADADAEIAKLALAAILIDTTNLTAEGKVTAVDRDAVSFLTKMIEAASPSDGTEIVWDRKTFFEKIQSAKAHSLDWLTVNEILGRDYKDWTESPSPSSGRKTVIGIASLVRPLSWIISKANNDDDDSNNKDGVDKDTELKPILDELRRFADERGLDVMAVMTAFTTTSSSSSSSSEKKEEDSGRFERELLVWGLNERCIEQVERFAETARDELKLREWDLFPFEGRCQEPGKLYIWRQEDVTKSRKQVAPLLRGVFSG